MRPARDFRVGRIYGVTQRGNQGQWVYRHDDDFLEALRLMDECARRYEVRVHGYCLLHNHGHWVLEASTEDSISCVMRDMQGRYSRYLNKKYAREPWLLLAPLDVYGRRAKRMYSLYRRSGPVNWTPRFDAVHLDRTGFKSFLRYVENNPVRAHLVGKASEWRWSSAKAHMAGSDDGGRLFLGDWRSLFGAPTMAGAAEAWREFVEGPVEAERANAALLAGWPMPYNRVKGWVAPSRTQQAGSAPPS